MERGKKIKRRLVERAVPRPVRRFFRWMNFHFKEDGRVIYRLAKTLPKEQREALIEQGKDLTTIRSKKNLPRGVRNVATSLVVGQCMWYFVCPALYKIPEVRESSWGWLASGGLDKLFLASDDLLYQTGGYSGMLATEAAKAAAGSVALGAATLAGELATDFSRCYIEYWSQKRYGIVADGAARAYGQVRPFPMRYSSLEAYQKIMSYILRPWTIGTSKQIFSSVYGILGSIWRTGPQLLLVITAGRAIDRFFKKISSWTGLGRWAARIRDEAAERENRALDAMKDILGEHRFTALNIQLAAESRTFWKWNPFRPAVKMDAAEKAAEAIAEYEALQTSMVESSTESNRELREAAVECAGRLQSIFGRRLRKFAPSYKGFSKMSVDESTDIQMADAFGDVIHELRTERELS